MPITLPSVSAPLALPFYYSSLVNCVVHYLVEARRVEPFLAKTPLKAALFGGRASVAFNFQAYSAQFSGGRGAPAAQWPASCIGVTQELELNIVAYPAAQAALLPEVSFEQWVMGDEQRKLMGNHRVFVPCDSDNAIQAGIELFGEPKFKTTFSVNLPSFNPVRKADVSVFEPDWIDAWSFRVNDPETPANDIFTCVADLAGLRRTPGNLSSIVEYGVHDNRAIACRWNILQPLDTYWLTADDARRVALSYGRSSHPMQKAMRELLAGAHAQAVQTFLSAPAAIQSRAVFI